MLDLAEDLLIRLLFLLKLLRSMVAEDTDTVDESDICWSWLRIYSLDCDFR